MTMGIGRNARQRVGMPEGRMQASCQWAVRCWWSTRMDNLQGVGDEEVRGDEEARGDDESPQLL